LPNWLQAGLRNPKFLQFEHLETSISTAKLQSASACAALTCLLVHQWRRAILPAPFTDVPLQQFTGEAKARASVYRCYKLLAPMASRWFDDAIGPRTGTGDVSTADQGLDHAARWVDQ